MLQKFTVFLICQGRTLTSRSGDYQGINPLFNLPVDRCLPVLYQEVIAAAEMPASEEAPVISALAAPLKTGVFVISIPPSTSLPDIQKGSILSSLHQLCNFPTGTMAVRQTPGSFHICQTEKEKSHEQLSWLHTYNFNP